MKKITLFIFLLVSVVTHADVDIGGYQLYVYNWYPYNFQNGYNLTISAAGTISGTYNIGVGVQNLVALGSADIFLGNTTSQSGTRTLCLGNNAADNGFSLGGAIGDFASMQGNNGFWIGNWGVGSNAFNLTISSNLFVHGNFTNTGRVTFSGIPGGAGQYLAVDVNGTVTAGTPTGGATGGGYIPGILTNTVDVLGFGISSASSDNTTAIQNAVNACAATNGGIVWLPDGYLHVAGTINLPGQITIKGMGNGEHSPYYDAVSGNAGQATKLIATTTNCIFRIYGTSTSRAGGDVIEDIGFVGPGLSGSMGVHNGGYGIISGGVSGHDATDHLQITRCAFTGLQYPIWLDQNDSTHISSCWINSCANGIIISNASVFTSIDGACNIADNGDLTAANTSGYGVWIGSGCASTSIEGNFFVRNLTNQIADFGASTLIVGNRFYLDANGWGISAWGNLIVLNGLGATVEANTAMGVAVTCTGSIAGSDSTACTFPNNWVDLAPSSSFGSVLPLVAGSGVTLTGNNNGNVTIAASGGGGSSLYNPAFYTTNASSQITPVGQTTNQMTTNITGNGVTNILGGSGAGANNGTNVSYSTDGTNFYGPDFIQLTTGGNRTTLDKSGITSTSFNGNGSGLSNITATSVSGWNTNQSFYQLDVVKSYSASGSKIQTTGTWSGSSHSVTVASAATWKTNEGIWLQAAGSPGTNLVTVVTAIAGNVLTLRDATTTGQTTLRVQHDDTFAISNACYDAYTNGGGLVYLQGRNTNGCDGYYRVNGPLVSYANSIITFPLNTNYSGIPRTVSIIGEGRGGLPDNVNGVYWGTAIESFDAQNIGATSFPSTIGCLAFNEITGANYGTNFEAINLRIDHLSIFNAANTGLGAVGCGNALACSIGESGDFGAYSVTPSTGAVPFPTVSCIGVFLPQVKNNIDVVVGPCQIIGYELNLLVGELAILNRPNIQLGNTGIDFFNPLAANFGSVSIQSCVYPIELDATNIGAPMQLALTIEEAPSASPFATIADWNDLRGNIATGVVTYQIFSTQTGTYKGITLLPTSETNNVSFVDLTKPPTLVAAQLTGLLPALNASQLTSLNASQLTAGTVPNSALPSTFTYGSPQLGMTNGVNVGIAMGFNTYYTNNYTSHRITETIDLSLTDQISTPVLIGVYPFQANGTPRMPRYVGTPLGVAAATTNSINLNMGVGEWFAITNIAGTASVVTNEVQIW